MLKTNSELELELFQDSRALDDKRRKLRTFLDGETVVADVGRAHWELLVRQLAAMEQYSLTLKLRLSLLK
jgi:hypothetical protein